MLKVSKINVYYGKAHIIWDVSFDVNTGEMVAIVGPNGAGKTSILKTISGLQHPASGEIFFLDKRIDKLPPHVVVESGLSHVPEGRGIFSSLTVLENLLVGAYTRKAKGNRKQTLREVFELFPVLEERKGQMAGTLSGGENQMLAIARGLMSIPTLLMLDEPSLGLAPIVVLNMFNTLEKLKEHGMTLLIIEQHIQHILQMADRSYVLENGRIVLHGTKEKLLSHEHIKKHYLGA